MTKILSGYKYTGVLFVLGVASADVVIMHKIFRKEIALFDIKRRCSYNNSTQTDKSVWVRWHLKNLTF